MQVSNGLRSKGPGTNAMCRMYRIDRLIRNGNYPNVPRLAKILEVSPRTVQRDLERLRDFMGAPLCFSWQKKGYYYTDSSFSLPPVNLSEDETVALFLGQRLLAQYRGTPFEKPVKTAFGKLLVLLPDYVSSDLEIVEKAVSFKVENLRGNEDEVLARYNCLLDAIRNSSTVSVIYYSAGRGEQTTRDINPYHLYFHEGAWYLIGYCHLRDDVRMFALDRILSIEVSGKKFNPDPTFSIQHYLAGSMKIERGDEAKEVLIRFEPFEARFIRERTWHPSQEIIEQSDGSVVLRMQLTGLGEVKRWAMSFGCHAEVLSPPELRGEIARELKKMAKNYR